MTPSPTPVSYKVEIHTHADQPGVWTGNDKRFGTPPEAEAYGRGLSTCQPSVVDWRVVESPDEPTHTFGEGEAALITLAQEVHSYQVEVNCGDPPAWTSTPLRFATHAEAIDAGAALYGRFLAVIGWRIAWADEAPTHSIDDQGQVRFLTVGPYYVRDTYISEEAGGQQA